MHTQTEIDFEAVREELEAEHPQYARVSMQPLIAEKTEKHFTAVEAWKLLDGEVLN